MSHLNIEIKAHCQAPEKVRKILLEKQAEFKGVDHQIDTYFQCPNGRLKLREGSIEKHLIFYQRADGLQPKASHVNLYKPNESADLRTLLTNALDIKVIVDKQRGIYFIENVKFHIDEVKDLGSFVEIEAIDSDNTIGEAKLLEQCQFYMKLLGIGEEDLISNSYSDMLLDV